MQLITTVHKIYYITDMNYENGEYLFVYLITCAPMLCKSARIINRRNNNIINIVDH